MCWNTESQYYLERKFAEKDIHVFKIVRETEVENTFMSYYFGHVYGIGKQYENILGLPVVCDFNEWYKIEDGFHSYSEEDVNVTKIGNMVYVKGRKKQLLDNYALLFNGQHCIVKLNCIIPQGALYYMNEFGEYVSDRIRVLSATGLL